MGRRLPLLARMKLRALKSLPGSLRTRLILLVLSTVLLVQAATLAAVSHYRQKFMAETALQYIAATIRTLRAALVQIPAAERAEFVRTASQNQWRLWTRVLPAEAQLQQRLSEASADSSALERGRKDSRAGRPPPAPDDPRPSLRGLVHKLNSRLDDGTRVALSRGPSPEIFISLSADPASGDGPPPREWLVIPLDRLNPPVATPLIAAWLGGLGLVLLLALGFSWHITRPITRLAAAADRLAAGQPQRVEPAGPHETRVLGERFNAMLDALAAAESVQRTLLAGLPHDLKGPLSRMWLRVELADDPALKEGLRKDLQDMQHMVDQFIGFLRGTDPAAYRYAPIALQEWLTGRVGGWQGAGSPVSLTLIGEGALIVQGDAIALGRLLDNLIRNALQHGAPPVAVTLRSTEGHAILEVGDQGPGIAAARRAEALRPFARLDNARTRSGNVGLGLALADAITRAHGGTLALTQAREGGLLVHVSLPLAAA